MTREMKLVFIMGWCLSVFTVVGSGMVALLLRAHPDYQVPLWKSQVQLVIAGACFTMVLIMLRISLARQQRAAEKSASPPSP